MSSTNSATNKAQNQMLGYLASSQTMHRFFQFCRAGYAPENFCAFYLIELYKRDPHKRMADFIIENYIKVADSAVALDADDGPYGPYTAILNLPSAYTNVDQVKGDLKATYAGIERDFKTKMASRGFIGALTLKISGKSKPPADLFQKLQDQCQTNLSDTHNRFLQKVGTIAVEDGGTPLANFKRDITLAGWKPKQLGIW